MSGEGEIEVVIVKNVIIVMGLKVCYLLNILVDNKIVLDNEGVLMFDLVLKKFVVIGVGVIGFEFGLVWCCFGVDVMVFEVLLVFFGVVDEVFVKEVVKLFKK